jgi:hypothetical protein
MGSGGRSIPQVARRSQPSHVVLPDVATDAGGWSAACAGARRGCRVFLRFIMFPRVVWQNGCGSCPGHTGHVARGRVRRAHAGPSNLKPARFTGHDSSPITCPHRGRSPARRVSPFSGQAVGRDSIQRSTSLAFHAIRLGLRRMGWGNWPAERSRQTCGRESGIRSRSASQDRRASVETGAAVFGAGASTMRLPPGS